jgi:hypothetical protein
LLHVHSLVLGLEFELNSEFGGVVFPGRWRVESLCLSLSCFKKFSLSN